MAIDWYPCVQPDCAGAAMVADERDGQPAFSVWQDGNGEYEWAAWNPAGGKPLAEGWGIDQQAAMDAAQRWLDAQLVSRPHDLGA